MADWDTCRRVPAPVKDPVSAMARTISSCLRSIVESGGRVAGPGVQSEAMVARSEINNIYSTNAIRLCLPGAIAAQGPDPVGKFGEIGQRALASGVGPRDLDVDVKRVFPGPSAQWPRFQLGQVDVAQRKAGQRLEERPGLAVQGEHDRGLVGVSDLRRLPGDDAESGDVVGKVLDRLAQDGESEHVGRAAGGDRGGAGPSP